MLRVLILLECDQCDEMLTCTPNSGSQSGIDLPATMHTLEHEAEKTGWSVYRSQHVCRVCMMPAMSEQRS